MSKFNITINSTHSTSTHTLVCGEVKVSQPLPNSITCPPMCDYDNYHIVMDRTVDKQFKDYFSKAPVYPKRFTTYDQAGFETSKYSETRLNNTPGTVENGIDPRILLSDIVLPEITGGQLFLILSSYAGLTSRNLDEQKEYIITHDLEMFKTKYDLSKVILFVVDTIESEISPYSDLSKIFKEVHVKPCAKIIPSFIEYVAGSVVSGSKPDFQGLLNFGTDVEINSGYFNTVEGHMNATIRRNGRVHIATTSVNSRSHFIILLSHSSPDKVKISESTTRTEYELVTIPNEEFTISEMQLQTMMEGILLMELLGHSTNVTDIVRYLLSDSLKVITYLVDSPILKVFKHSRETVPRLDHIINNYMMHVQTQIHDNLISHFHSDHGVHYPHLMQYHRGGYPPSPPPPVQMARQVSEYTSRS